MLKDMLLLLSTFPDPTGEAALGPAVRFARRNESAISGLALDIDIHEPTSSLFSLIIDVHSMVSAAKDRSRQAGARLHQWLKEICVAEQVTMEARNVTF